VTASPIQPGLSQGIRGTGSTNSCYHVVSDPQQQETPDMTPDRARELIAQQISFGSGYNRNAVRLILGEIHRVHGQATVDELIIELDLEQAFGLKPGTDFSKVGR
jgi:hypothetical protein